ncbi:MAG: hypothetical protein QF689_10025 [Candidatus Latescibacteria bacterium]|jgi:hypothetical protein|nr:hypothetical protein [Candidatus Latescibacterota bacterium]MDP7448912.1 hypothetical protein [Candidatus Latescibacterota bacterium]HJP33376.1 hypothetical protein [Candidatus Latescibacterota bacterium]
MIIDAHNHPNWHGHDADRRLKAAVEIHGIRLASELKVRLVFPPITCDNARRLLADYLD